MTDDPEKEKSDAREHSRHSVSFAVQMSVSLKGVDAADRPFEAQGRTINLSKSGMLARVDRHLPIERRCLVHFRDAEHKLEETRVHGVVVRCDPFDDGVAIAVEFESPLEFKRSRDSGDD